MKEDQCWVESVVNSCTNEAHLEYAHVLLNLFYQKHGDPQALLELESIWAKKLLSISLVVN